ncbi:RagB/SusD family nutrient uptake outer membrane protein [Niastella populi]|uniref:Carbohydrate-binding protein SusD n=1 Tax=Niastella populi TaxID=550983 RepID=A0A1V9F870_9BACT|nr:RagB/SusD family nutrient uptake outer membrane protein [Niastella populi]OQP54416.1 hypothetical protein A4R26_28060 [Niastella populi]
MKSIYNAYKSIVLIGMSVVLIAFCSCKKDWLDAKPNKALAVPSTVRDYQALLDNSNSLFNIGAPGLGEISSDNCYMTVPVLQAREIEERNSYIWAKDIYEGMTTLDWEEPYRRILNTNIILDGIQKVSKDASVVNAWNNVKGSALFYRAFDFFNLSQVFAGTYTNGAANSELGIPLRLSSNVNEKPVRSNLQHTYHQILSDLQQSITLLPVRPEYKTRPSKPAAFAMLSRVYLSMSDFESAGKYADSALRITDSLIDYNTLKPSDARPFKRYNPEVIFHNLMLVYGGLVVSRMDTVLLKSYEVNDLRMSLFANSVNSRFKGSYDGTSSPFNGLATDEMYLIRSECKARLGDVSGAMADLNALLVKRWKTGLFVPVVANSTDEALVKILSERRKELCFRGLRWTDLKRLNREPKFAKTLTRVVDTQVYTLPPNDPRYVLPIPLTEIRISGIEQNPR